MVQKDEAKNKWKNSQTVFRVQKVQQKPKNKRSFKLPNQNCGFFVYFAVSCWSCEELQGFVWKEEIKVCVKSLRKHQTNNFKWI